MDIFPSLHHTTFFIAVATGIGLHHNYKELTTRVRIKHIYFLPLTVGGLASFLYTRHNYLSCKAQFMKDLEQYHKDRNYAPYPELRQGTYNLKQGLVS